MIPIGILALQGCVEPHEPHLEPLDACLVPVKKASDFHEIRGLILPGGESSTFLKLLKDFELESTLKETFERIPVWGICAGSILMAQKVYDPVQLSFHAITMTVQRNAYGRQNESFVSKVQDYPVLFIRAPKIIECSKTVKVIATWKESPIWVESGIHMATTFHSELSEDYPSPMHRAFLNLVRAHDRK
jgi:5'-phosphate synthase pdxT subunit